MEDGVVAASSPAKRRSEFIRFIPTGRSGTLVWIESQRGAYSPITVAPSRSVGLSPDIYSRTAAPLIRCPSGVGRSY